MAPPLRLSYWPMCLLALGWPRDPITRTSLPSSAVARHSNMDFGDQWAGRVRRFSKPRLLLPLRTAWETRVGAEESTMTSSGNLFRFLQRRMRHELRQVFDDEFVNAPPRART